MILRALSGILLAVLSGLLDARLAQTADAPQGELIIGVRSKARPFSYKLPAGVVASDATRGPLGYAGYAGYMVRVCDAALAEMLVDPKSSEGLTLEQVRVYDIDEGRLVPPRAETAAGQPPNTSADPPPAVDQDAAQGPGQDRGPVTGLGTPQASSQNAANVSVQVPATNFAAPSAQPEPSKQPAASRFEQLGKTYDILCDPATVTNERRSIIVSPPVFLTGISYLTLKNQPTSGDPCGLAEIPAAASEAGAETASPPPGTASGSPQATAPATGASANGASAAGATKPTKGEETRALIGLVAGTTSRSRGIQALINAREMPQFEAKMLAELRSDGKRGCEPDKVLVREYASHEEAAQKFCAGEEFQHYVGDLEIIRSYASAIPGCDFTNGSVTYTNDRYAVFGQALGTRPEAEPDAGSGTSGTRPAASDRKRELLVARFFAVLTQKVIFNPSVLDKAYDDSFAGQPQSRKLKLFYWSIRGERLPEPQTDPALPSRQ